MHELDLKQGYTVHRTKPINLEIADLELFSHEFCRKFPSVSAVLRRAVCFQPTGYCFDQAGRCVAEACLFEKSNVNLTCVKRVRGIVKYVYARLVRWRQGDYFVLSDPWSIGYFHWLTDALPRVEAMWPELRDHTLVLPKGYQQHEYIGASIKAIYGLNVEFLDHTYCFEHLVIPGRTSHTGNPRPVLTQRIRERVLRSLKICQTKPTKLIYISRSSARTRRTVNEAQVERVLDSLGFEIVLAEKLKFEEQVKLFSGARLVVANHGAGLTNMLFMQQGAAAIELRLKGDRQNNCYYALADAQGIKYFYQQCETQGDLLDLEVDCAKLRKLIELALSYTNDCPP